MPWMLPTSVTNENLKKTEVLHVVGGKRYPNTAAHTHFILITSHGLFSSFVRHFLSIAHKELIVKVIYA